MNWLRKTLATIAVKAAGYAGITFSLSDPDLNQKLGGWYGIGGTYTGKAVTDRTAMQVTTVWACVRLLSLRLRSTNDSLRSFLAMSMF